MSRRKPLNGDDHKVARRLEKRIDELEMTPGDVASRIRPHRLSDQQVRNYINAKNPISVGMLVKLARVLDCTPCYFFHDD